MSNNHPPRKAGRESPKLAAIEGKMPPQNIQAEKNVIGSALIDNRVIDEIVLFLKPTDFFRDLHEELFRAICELRSNGKPVDFDILAEELRRRGRYTDVGGDDYIAEILEGTPHAHNALHYAQIVKQKSIKRQYGVAAQMILQSAFSDEETAEQTGETAEREVFAVSDQESAGDVKVVGELIDDTLARMEERKSSGDPTGICTGIVDLDEATGGIRPEHAIYIAARTSTGKTALALCIAEHIAVNLGIPALFVSLEMSADELMDRLVALRANIDAEKLQSGELTREDCAKAHRTREAILAAPLFLDDTSSRSVLQIGALARRIKMRHGLKVLFVDYIQLVDPDDPRDTRQVQIAKISRRLKKLARELGITIIILSQLNRGPENRESHRPRLADLRESGDQEQDADLVLLLHRPSMYDKTKNEGVGVIIIAKNRHGRRKDVRVSFLAQSMKFADLAPGYYQDSDFE